MLTEYQIRVTRANLISEIQQLVQPQLRESNFREGPLGNSKSLRLCVIPNRKDGGFGKTVTGYHALEEIIGFTEAGVITDASGGGIVTTIYNSLPLEDLVKLFKFVKRIKNELE